MHRGLHIHEEIHGAKTFKNDEVNWFGSSADIIEGSQIRGGDDMTMKKYDIPFNMYWYT